MPSLQRIIGQSENKKNGCAASVDGFWSPVELKGYETERNGAFNGFGLFRNERNGQTNGSGFIQKNERNKRLTNGKSTVGKPFISTIK